MKMTMNPILKKEIRVSSRSFRLPISLLLYDLINGIIFLIASLIIIASASSSYPGDNVYQQMRSIFPTLGIAQSIIILLFVPILTANAISGERERQTFDIMLTTCMSPFSIVFGKVLSAIARILLYVTSVIPILSLSFILGGMRWRTLLTFVVCMIIISLFAASIGILCSSFSNKTVLSTILSYAIGALFIGGTFFPLIIETIVVNWLNDALDMYLDETFFTSVFLLANPAVFLEEYFAKVMVGTSVFSYGNDHLFIWDAFPMNLLTYGHIWIILSGMALILISFLFMLLASWRINPLHARKNGK